MSLRWRAVLTLGAIELGTLLVVIATGLYYLEQAGQREITQRAEETAALLKVAIGESLMIVNYASVAEIIDAAFMELPDLDYLAAFDAQGQTLGSKRRGHDLLHGPRIERRADITVGANVLGSIVLHYATDALTADLANQRQAMILWAGPGLLLSALITWISMSRLTGELEQITARLSAAAKGQAVAPIPEAPPGELGRLVASYNAAVANLDRHGV